eukprot:573797-Prymnesium_polylepis.8
MVAQPDDDQDDAPEWAGLKDSWPRVVGTLGSRLKVRSSQRPERMPHRVASSRMPSLWLHCVPPTLPTLPQAQECESGPRR